MLEQSPLAFKEALVISRFLSGEEVELGTLGDVEARIMEEGQERLRQLASLHTSRPVEMRKGIVRRTLVFSERMLLCHWQIKAGTRFGEHSHAYEQAGFVLRGRILMIIDGVEHELGPGDSYLVLPNVKHDALAIEEVEVVDVFSPLREEYVD